jgi:hypothetical protein
MAGVVGAKIYSCSGSVVKCSNLYLAKIVVTDVYLTIDQINGRDPELCGEIIGPVGEPLISNGL